MDILHHIPCAVLVTDLAGNIVFANAEVRALCGMSEPELLDTQMDVLFPPASRIFLQTHVWPMLMKDGDAREVFLHFGHPDRRRIPVLANCRRWHQDTDERIIWTFLSAEERSKFESELLAARARAEAATAQIAEKERFFKAIANSVPAWVAYWDSNYICRFANYQYLDWFGRTADEMIGIHLRDLLGPERFEINQTYVAGVLRGESQTFERSYHLPDGTVTHVLARYIPDYARDGSVVGFFAMITDVTSVKTAEADLRLAASVFENTIEAIMVTDEAGHILSVNPAFTEMTGYVLPEVLGQFVDILHSPRQDPRQPAEIQQAVETYGRWEGQVWRQRRDGVEYLTWQSVTRIRGEGGVPMRHVSVFNDITELRRKEERIRHLAFHDPLTDLPNRALLMERLGELIVEAASAKTVVAVMFMDLDGFKAINDSYGHETGDEVLRIVAQKLRRLIRRTDMVARLGGDEFVILFHHPSSRVEVGRIAERIVSAMREPLSINGTSVQIGTSMGISLFGQHGDTAADLLKTADQAMYDAKAAGRNGYRFANVRRRVSMKGAAV